MQIDEEIPINKICHLIKKDKIKQIYHSRIFDCTDFLGNKVLDDIYFDEDDTEDICE